MKKFVALALLLGVVGSAVVGCEPAKKAEPAKAPAAEAPKTDAPAEAPK